MLLRCASVNGIALTATSETRINAFQNKWALIDELACFCIFVEVGLLNYCNPVPCELGTILTRRLEEAASLWLTQGLQLDLGDRAKRCFSEDPAPAAYSAVLKIR